jgi:hypothetical protein
MIFKVEPIEENVHLVRAYRKSDDMKYCFVCTLYKAKNEKQWQIKATMSDKGTIKEAKEVLQYLKSYPSGVYTYVTKDDFERFYKRFCKRIKFDDCNF